jgi:nucleotide-binding universal stress UspA family protein
MTGEGIGGAHDHRDGNTAAAALDERGIRHEETVLEGPAAGAILEAARIRGCDLQAVRAAAGAASVRPWRQRGYAAATS